MTQGNEFGSGLIGTQLLTLLERNGVVLDDISRRELASFRLNDETILTFSTAVVGLLCYDFSLRTWFGIMNPLDLHPGDPPRVSQDYFPRLFGQHLGTLVYGWGDGQEIPQMSSVQLRSVVTSTIKSVRSLFRQMKQPLCTIGAEGLLAETRLLARICEYCISKSKLSRDVTVDHCCVSCAFLTAASALGTSLLCKPECVKFIAANGVSSPRPAPPSDPSSPPSAPK